MKNSTALPLLAAAVSATLLTLVGCASGPTAQELDAQAQAMIRAAFRDEGIAKVDRLNQDLANAECSKAAGKPLPDALAKSIEQANLATLRAPTDGRYLGDWKSGEKIAQDGRGMTWTDSDKVANGGNCYNCHQITKAEISFGTIGPSLYQYGRIRGITDPGSAVAKPFVEYTWGKLWNARAFSACSNMPRFGHAGVLTEAQIRDVMALLLDPQSPVNAQ
jgi:sulfur-oxidizing protein SoxX